ncbi:hypothetical protein LTR10_011256 [Elasticomyces elasticus]|nr:hypothetical protein LTR10_011256 [Elasticomyces elasticus]KAK4966328.1 hypothetical protein LTR42_011489 [Elasticomyces elasticus]
MPCDDCTTGFAWDGKPSGTEATLASNNTYVVGDSQKYAILVVADFFGWTMNNIRLLADHYAKTLNATVYVPDFYDGEVMHPDTLSDPERQKAFDREAWLARNSREKRWPEVKACAQALKAQYSKVAAVGYCWGGWACFQLAADPSLVDAIATAHPGLFDKNDVDAVKVPVQLIAPEDDFTFTPELKQYCFETLPKTGVQWEYVFFAGYRHGFASRGEIDTVKGRAGMERARNCVVHFFEEFLR